MKGEFIKRLLIYFQDPSVHELCLNGIRSLSLFKENLISTAASPFDSEENLIRLCQDFARQEGKRLDPYCPSAGGKWEKFRWHCLIPPASAEGIAFSLRRHRFENIDVKDFQVRSGLEDLLQSVFENRNNHIVFCGPTGSGKTSFISAYLKKYALEERVILVEEYAEIPLFSPHWLRLLSKPNDLENRGEVKLSFLIEESLRLRPDRLVLGEIRNKDALVFFETLLLGHHGSLSTLHASEMCGVRRRIDALLAMRGGSREEFWKIVEGLKDLYFVFLERGSPPSIVGIHQNLSSSS